MWQNLGATPYNVLCRGQKVLSHSYTEYIACLLRQTLLIKENTDGNKT